MAVPYHLVHAFLDKPEAITGVYLQYYFRPLSGVCGLAFIKTALALSAVLGRESKLLG